MAQLCLWTKIRTKQWLVLDASAFQSMRADLLCPKWDTFACFVWKDDLLPKIRIFCKSIAGPLSEAKSHWLQFLNQLNFVWRQRSLCKICLNDISEMFNYWERRWIDVDGAAHTQQQYSRLYALFLAFHALVYRWGCQFLSLSSCNITMIFKVICRNISQRCSSVYTTIFVRRKDKTNYLANQTWAK